MSFSTGDVGHLLLALALLLSAGHAFGYIFRRLRQPPVIGEILGGLLLGPTFFGALLPEWQHAVFSANRPTRVVLGAIYQLGLLLLMFCSGAEMRSAFQKGDRRTVVLITLTGTFLPLAAGLFLAYSMDIDRHLGTAANRTALVMVFGIAIAVTSIPVISRILADLGILETPFARIVLSAAVVEDVILYVILSAALSMVGRAHGDALPGLAAWLGLEPGSWGGLAYHVLTSLVFFGVAVVGGPFIFRNTAGFRFNVLRRSSPIANLLLFMVAATGVAILLGITPMLGAFVAGLAVGRSADAEHGAPREVIKSFSYAFFIPIYFTIVGLKLNLATAFDAVFFVQFLLLACAIKATSVFLGAKLAGETNAGAFNLAVAMNARGGPGIVLASLALDSGIINEHFYSTLVMLAIVTSLLAGSWLELVLRRHWRLR